LSHTRPTCGTGQPCYTPRRRRQQQRRRHQTWRVFPRFSRDPARLDLPLAARGVFPEGRGASPAGRGASPRERGPNPPRSWALVKTSPSRALLTSFFTSSGRGCRNEDGNLLLKWAESSKKVGVSSSSSPLVSKKHACECGNEDSQYAKRCKCK
jgi:hypothetical protein